MTARRPGWAGWLVGRTASVTRVLRTPSARLRGRWLELDRASRSSRSSARRCGRSCCACTVTSARCGSPVRAGRSTSACRQRDRNGREASRSAAVPRAWERLPDADSAELVPGPPARRRRSSSPPPARCWLPAARSRSRSRARCARSSATACRRSLRPRPVAGASSTPIRSSFEPRGLGYPLSSHIAVRLPEPVGLPQASGRRSTRTLEWDVRHGTILRLEQLLAQAGYLPLAWSPAADPPRPTARTELAATVDPPAGRFRWRYDNTPHELHALWKTGEWNEIVRGAVMMFEDTHRPRRRRLRGAEGVGRAPLPTRSPGAGRPTATATSTSTATCRSP